MSRNREFLRQLSSARARFYPADFHVHGPASADLRNASRFSQLSREVQNILNSIPANITKNPADYEAKVISRYPPSEFYKSLLARRDAILSEMDTEDGGNWAIVALTDHNVCKYSCELASQAWDKLKEHCLIVMPGIELTVNYPVPPNSLASAHLLCIFSAKTSDSDIRMAVTYAAEDNWEFGQSLTLKCLPTFVQKIRHHKDYPAICIAAHIGSSSGVQSETRNAILSRLDAAISRTRGELSSGDTPDVDGLHERLAQLEGERDSEEIALEALDLVGRCGFDALQVKGRTDEIHYRLLHRFKGEMGRAVPIVCSDAHRQEDVFATESGIPHLKLSSLSSGMDSKQVFNAIARALRLGETRFSFVPPSAPFYWISGIEIYRDAPQAAQFWPFGVDADSKSKPFVLPLSRNLNCFIGGRGSGKSAALEAIAFLCKESDFNGFSDKNKQEMEEHYEYYSRAQATLSGCNLKACWQYVDREQAKSLPKNALFASRYFDPTHHHPAVTYFSAEDSELVPEQIPEHHIQYYRLGEIEKQAGPSQLRVLFDQICGKQIGVHEALISRLLVRLREQRAEMVGVSKKIAELTQIGSSLRQYALRKRLYDEVNTTEVREAYEQVDQVTATESHVDNATKEWATIHGGISLDGFAKDVTDFFDNANKTSVDGQGLPKPFHEKLAALSSAKPSDSQGAPTLCKRVSDAIASLSTKLNSVGEALTDAKTDIVDHVKTARDALAGRGLPTGSKDREAKKAAFEEAQQALESYRGLLIEWDTMNNKRKKLVELLQNECQSKTALRQQTATKITDQLRRDLDPSVLIIQADAQGQTDRSRFINWLESRFSSQDFKHRRNRVMALVSQGLTPAKLRDLFLNEGGQTVDLLQVEADTAESGAISSTVAQSLFERCVGRCKVEPEDHKNNSDQKFWESLPIEIRDGLFTFPAAEKNPDALKIDDILQLDEITFDDEPVIMLNDRPKDDRSKPRRIEEVSRGQRCSAILPILLLTGTSPLLIDQPEDNMDNRLIRQVITNILSSIKLRRQVIFATHNPNLPVLGDVEQAVILQGVGEKECEIRAVGDLDKRDVVHHLTEVMEGGREAFQYRQTIYQVHWPGVISTTQSLKGTSSG
ncbi:MAG: AAA family ATPase [Syntrophorhabdaceae bacterium]|nr:AAA family ATPase [Syntrophorhabdaceae bacterium]MDD5243395.1 AAA family ATPase [Syntrophorhabdaceae bacterium]